MAIFRGRVLLIGDTTTLPADMTIEPDRIAVASGGIIIGDWNRSDVALESRGDGVLIRAEGEGLLFLSNDRRLTRALGLMTHPSNQAPIVLTPESPPAVRPRAKHLKKSQDGTSGLDAQARQSAS